MKIKDTDYLYATMRIRANEKNLLSREKFDRMIDAKTPEEAAKVIVEAGYGDIHVGGKMNVERVLADMRADTRKLISDITKNNFIADVFAVKYDFHNIKVIIKSELVGGDVSGLLSSASIIPPEKLESAVRSGDMRDLPQEMANAVLQAREVIAHTNDPQAADFLLDRACFDMMLDLAHRSGSEFLCGYVRLSIDVANLRTAVRVARQNRGTDVLKAALIPGGNVQENAYITGNFSAIFSGSELCVAAEEGMLAADRRAELSKFECLLDNAIIAYMKTAKYVSFNERPIVAYIGAKESEAMAIRIIMAGKAENLPADEIRSRLRLSYV